MSDVINTRTYKRRLEASRGNMSAEEIARQKNAAIAARNRAQHEANIARDAAHVPLVPEEQLKALDQRLGRGVGAKRERKRLMALLAGD